MRKQLALLLCYLSAGLTAAQATSYWFDSAPFTLYGEFNPTPLFSTTQSGHTVKELQPSQSIRFASSTASISIYSFSSVAAARTYVVLQDGVQVSSTAIPTDGGGNFSLYSLATGLDTGSVHEYEILCVTPIQGQNSNWYDGYLELDNLASVAHPNRFVWGMYGDSITAMTAAHQTDIESPLITDTRYGDMYLATKAINRAMFVAGVAGGKVVNTGRDSTGNIPSNVDGVRVEYGTNDLPDLPSGDATFQTAYGVMIDNIRTRIGAGKPIVCLQPFPRATPPSSIAHIGTLIQAAISGKANVTYYDTTGWIDTDASKMPDGLHPNAAGYAQLAPHEYGPLGGNSITTTTLNVTNLIISP